jgi:hypothetical protein
MEEQLMYSESLLIGLGPLVIVLCFILAALLSRYSTKPRAGNLDKLHNQLTELEKLIFIEDDSMDRDEWVRDIHRRFHSCHLTINAHKKPKERKRSRSRARLPTTTTIETLIKS